MTESISDLKSLGEIRAEKVRRLRNMANLSRQEMCSQGDIKIDTLIGWEVGRHGGLTEKGAKKVIERISKEGVICSVDWLLHNIGQGPTVISNFHDIQESLEKTSTLVGDEDQLISRELLFFKQNNQDSVELEIIDDSMLPIYSKGDFVAGIKRYQDKLNTLVGLDCIVQLMDGSLLLRKILEGSEKNKYTLVVSNLQKPNHHNIILNTTLAFAAPIIWHRKRNPIF